MHVALSQMWMSVHWAMTSAIRPATTQLAATHAAVTLDTPLMPMAADVMVCRHDYCLVPCPVVIVASMI